MARRSRPTDSHGVLKIGRTAYAVDVFWLEIEDPTKGAQEAKEHASRSSIGGDFYVVSDANSQIGVGHKASGHSKGMPCLAPLLSAQHPGSWIAVFQAGTGYYVVATTSDRRILFDNVYPDIESLADAVSPTVHDRQFSRSVMPQEVADALGRPFDEEMAIADFVVAGKAPKLVPISSATPLVKILFLAILLAGAGLGWMYWQQYQADLALQDSFQTDALNVPPPVHVPAPWENREQGAPLLTACVDAMRATQRTYAGWDVVSIDCGATGATQTLGRQPLSQGGSPITWVRTALDASGHEDIAISSGSADGLVVAWPVATVEKWTPDSGNDGTIRDSTFLLQSLFEEKFTEITFAPAQVAQSLEAPQPGAPTFSGQQFTFSTSFEPSYFAPVLERIPGLVVDQVSYDQTTSLFTVMGAFYEKSAPVLPQ